jgi:micrococcal nuclease
MARGLIGTAVPGIVMGVTDGDTVRIRASDNRQWKVRVLGLDTEESDPDQRKPVTRWGRAAADFARKILPRGTPVTIELPGRAPALVDGKINIGYLDNHGRPVGALHLADPVDGTTDFARIMIRRGYSPYFVKYGRACFAPRDAAYSAAERAAQAEDIGVWNQFESNRVLRPEDAPRNYAQLSVWWELRARVVDEFRAARDAGKPVLSARVDYRALLERARAGETATVFMEIKQGAGARAEQFVFRSGSRAQPFKLFLPQADSEAIALLRNRYITQSEAFPRRNYAFVTGPLRLYHGVPELIVESVDQVSDSPPD